MEKLQKRNSYEIAEKLILFSIPLIGSGILQQLYNWVDALVLGNVLGERALAAVGATTYLINVYLSILMGFCTGIMILCAQKFGKGQKEQLSSILIQFSVFFFLLFLFLAGLGILFSKKCLNRLNTPENIFGMASEYLRIILIGIPFLSVYNVYSAVLRGMGDSRTPFYSILVSSVLNTVLDILFVAVFHWGMGGAAAATVLSQISMTLFTILYTNRHHPKLQFKKLDLKWSIALWKEGFHFGVPPMVQHNISAMGGLVLQNFMNSFGASTVAAISTCYRVDLILMLPIFHLSSGISSLTAQYYGAKQKENMKGTLLVGVLLGSGIGGFLYFLVLHLGPFLLGAFGAGREVMDIGIRFFCSIGKFYVIFGLAMAFRGFLEGIGDLLFSSAVGIAGLFIRIFYSYQYAPWAGNMAIAYSEGTSWVFLIVVYLFRFFWLKNKRRI